ncbi:hypothetical protein A2866_06240 [Candidatus Roizmanbacteria bacterium RIFCSPHIGHO2_01_FULL_39_8]|uniref:GH16 domain-containing protein n=1 Tax=Candidatus Roizmanbacteria bacterium RIFCSPHIGHO2_01_FULL_39_8 TaxID=1802033 RepID=A0A1F7GMD3_9BACT|nr:MAG: hypothetical protein A2866_06240 [Candidatus Roizmanbacteria bacterium RIFCSPHIGHO2_01_FULL_39_8]
MVFFEPVRQDNSHVRKESSGFFGKIFRPIRMFPLFGLIRMKLNLRTLLLYVTSAVVIVVAAVIFYLNFAKKSAAAWFDDNWSYRQTVTITNSGSNQTDFQVSFTLDTETLINNSKMQADCDDVRVTDLGGNILPHVIEEGSAPCDNSATKIWVKVPSITTSGAIIYMYYGNPVALNTESGIQVFDFFDNFNTNSLDNSKWRPSQDGSSTPASYSFSGGAMTITTGSIYTPDTQLSDSRSYMYEYRTQWSSTVVTYSGLMIANVPGTQGGNAGSHKLIYMMSNSGTSIAQRGWAADGTVASYNLASDMALYTPTAATYYVDGFSMDSSQIKFWNNGSQTGTTVTGTWTAAPYLYLGYFVGDNSLTTNITDITVDWVRARKYASTAPSASIASEEKSLGPVSYWRFDDGQGTSAQDSSQNNNDGTLAASTATPTWQTEDFCVSEKCLLFDGSNDYVSVGNVTSLSFNGTAPFTLQSWVKPTTSTQTTKIITKYNSGVAGDFYLGLVSGKAIVHREVSPYTLTGSTTLPLSEWSLITGVYDGTNLNLYVNGKLDAGPQASGSITSTSTGVLIGAMYSSSSPASFFAGFLDETKVYDYARSADQIKLDYNNSGINKGAGVRAGQPPENNYQALNNGLVGYWKMDESSWTNNCSTTSVTDLSGNGNNGKACPNSTGPTGGAVGKFGYAGDFDGTNDYVSVADTTTHEPANISFGAWIYEDVTGDSWLIEKHTSTPDDYTHGYVLRLNSDDTIQCWIGNGTTSAVANTAISATVWTHALCTYDGDKVRLYLNGELKSTSSSLGGSIDYTSVGHLTLGADSQGTRRFNGKLDEVRIYNRTLTLSEVGQLYNFAPRPDAYWKMEENDGNRVDSVAGLTMSTATGTVSRRGGKIGAAAYFPNTAGQYLNMNDSATVSMGNLDFTVEAWFRMAYKGDIRTILDKGSGAGATNQEYTLYYDSVDDRFEFQISDGSTSTTVGAASLGSPSAGTWYHVAGWYDSTANYVGVTINGAYTDKTSQTTGSQNTAGQFTVGANRIGSSHHAGEIDEVKVYRYLRTTKQIVEDMNAGHPAPGSPVGSPVAYWRLDEGYGTTSYDTSTNANNATLKNIASPATSNSGWSQNGKFAKTLVFDGSNDYLYSANSGSLQPANFTISAWLKTANLATDMGALEKPYAGPGCYRSYVLGTNNGSWTVGTTNGSSTYYNATDTVSLTANEWTHVVGTFDGSNIKLYVNGILKATTAASVTVLYDSDPLLIGAVSCDGTGGPTQGYWNGLIDEVKIYSSALTADQIKVDYNRAQAVQFGVLGTSTSDGKTASDSAATSYCVPGDTSTCNPPKAEWNFEEGSGATVYDTSGNGNNGTWNASTSDYRAGKIGKAMYADGTTEYIDISANSSIPNRTTYTITFWAKFGSTTYARMGRWIDPNYDWLFEWTSSTIKGYAMPSSGNVCVATSGSLSINTWYYVALTFTNSTTGCTLYINGQSVAAGASGGFGGATGSTIRLWSGNAGSIRYGDQIRIYDYVRSQAQILWEYNRGAPSAYWKLDECQGSTTYDSSGNSLSGTIYPGSGGETSIGDCNTSSTMWGSGQPGKWNYALDFDGTDDYITVADNALIEATSKNFTASAWIYPNAVSSNMAVVAKGTCGVSWSDYELLTTGTNLQFTFSTSGGATSTVTGTKTLSTNTWYHVAGTYDGSNLKVYVNGVLDNSAASTNTPNDTTDVMAIGGRTTNGSVGCGSVSNQHPFDGKIDDVKIFNYALTNYQLLTEFNQGSAVRFGPNTGAP